MADPNELPALHGLALNKSLLVDDRLRIALYVLEHVREYAQLLEDEEARESQVARPEPEMIWVPAYDCTKAHAYGEEGWRPGLVYHEHLVEKADSIVLYRGESAQIRIQREIDDLRDRVARLEEEPA